MGFVVAGLSVGLTICSGFIACWAFELGLVAYFVLRFMMGMLIAVDFVETLAWVGCVCGIIG